MPRSKTIQSGRPVRSWEQPFRVADLFQTYLPMLVLIVIMALFIYNLGYFYGLDWRYMSLLRTRDYYSGTLPGLVLAVAIGKSLRQKYLPQIIAAAGAEGFGRAFAAFSGCRKRPI